MKTLIALRHVPFEDLGVLEPLCTQHGYQIKYYDLGVQALQSLDNETIDLLVILGGPIGVYDDALYPFLQTELEFIQQRLLQKRPTLGICLGAQLMARALGANVYPMGVKEIGFAPLELTQAGQKSVLAPLNSSVAVLHWHGDQFDIPEGLTSLAKTAICPHQAFALENYALALQFHLETDLGRIEQWLIGHSAELAQAKIAPNTIRTQAQQQANLLPTAMAVFEKWLNNLKLPS